MFARHYLRNLGWFLFLRLLRCFSSPGLPPSPYIFRSGYPCGWVSPFGYFRIKAYLSAPRNFSQIITSFIACNRQGIHHMHLFTWPYNVKTWTLFKFKFRGAWDTSYRFSKATSSSFNISNNDWFVYFNFIFINQTTVKSNSLKWFSILQSINTVRLRTILPITNTSSHHNLCIHLYFFHFVKEQSS